MEENNEVKPNYMLVFAPVIVCLVVYNLFGNHYIKMYAYFFATFFGANAMKVIAREVNMTGIFPLAITVLTIFGLVAMHYSGAFKLTWAGAMLTVGWGYPGLPAYEKFIKPVSGMMIAVGILWGIARIL